ncbi:MAG TPA: c(7)-type cytochrome triheme domain-containing protein [Desulfuromonadaceae bacterium]|jgi:c(7)-type cytochrome triheme protein
MDFKRTLTIILASALLVFPSISKAADIQKTLFIATQKAGKVPFEHDAHLKRLESNCSACHNSIFHVVRKKNLTFTMADMETGKSCGACHKKENPGATQLSSCTKCHPVGDVPIIIPDFGTLLFSHGKHLGMYTCGDCHNELFKTNRENPHYSMSQMEQGKSCGACHEGKTAFSVKGDCVKCHQVGDVKMASESQFSHKLHLEFSYKCIDCHNKLFIPGPNRSHETMLDMEGGKSCGACHDGKTAFSVKGDCQKCHKNINNIDFKAFNGHFNHPTHIALFKCNDCHSSIFVGGSKSIRYTMPQMEKGKSCGACHDGKTAFGVTSNCEKCHPGSLADITFQIKHSGIVKFSHAKHRSLYACGDCHNAILGTGVAAKRFSMADMDKGKSCGACHDDKTAFSVKKCSKCHPVKEILFTEDARFNHDRHLAMYSCTDCHNQLFKAGPDNTRFTMAQMEKGNSCGGCHEGKSAFSVKGDCDKCHKSSANITFTTKEAGSINFSHKIHTALFKCSDCHNGIFIGGKGHKQASMSDMEKGKSCGACHEGKTAFGLKDGCARCHPVKEINFKPGSAVFSHKVHIAAYSCKDCHPNLFIPGPGNKPSSMILMEKGQSCGSCHDDKTVFGVKANCQKCHPRNPKTIRFELPVTTGNVDFSHKVHVLKGYNCNDCHYTIVASGLSNKRWVMKEMDQGAFCGACHGLSMAFSVKDPMACERCHQKESDWRPQPLQH